MLSSKKMKPFSDNLVEDMSSFSSVIAVAVLSSCLINEMSP